MVITVLLLMKRILFQKLIGSILLIVMLPCSIFSQSNANSQNPFAGKKYQEKLLLGKYAFDFTHTDKNGIDVIGIKIDEWFQIDDFIYFYYLWDNKFIYVLDTDRAVLFNMEYSLSAEGKELKILNDDGTFIELQEKGSLVESATKDAVTGVISIAAMIWGGKTIYKATGNK